MSLRALVKVDSKGRVTIPLYLREAIGIEPESYVELEVNRDEGVIILRPASTPGELAVDFEVILNRAEDVQQLTAAIVESGGEVRLLRCYREEGDRYRCQVTTLVLDLKAAELLKNKVSERGLKVISLKPVIRRAM